MKEHFIALCFICLGFAVKGQKYEQIYRPIYHTATNPSGCWAYGDGDLGGDFTPFGHYMESYPGIVAWMNLDRFPAGIHFNVTDRDIYWIDKSTTYESNSVFLQGEDKAAPSRAVSIQFTAPKNGRYELEVRWNAVHVVQKKAYVYVFSNAEGSPGNANGKGFKELYQQTIRGLSTNPKYTLKGLEPRAQYSVVLYMKKGEQLLFSMSYRGEDYFANDIKTDIVIGLLSEKG